MVESHKDLKVWQDAMLLVKAVYDLTDSFPTEERYGLISQLRRSAISIPSNIAEGSARSSTKEFINFLSIARGSLAELETQLELARIIGYMNEIPLPISTSLNEIGRMLTGLQRSLRKRVR